MRETPVRRHPSVSSRVALAALVALAAAACGGDDGVDPDGGVSTAHCTYTPVAATAGVGQPVSAAALSAGAGEVALDVPVGTALGGYTARAGFLGNAGMVDNRIIPIAAGFHPSVGIETRPMAKAVALRVGTETVVWIKLDAIFVYEDMVFELERRLGSEFAGKVMVSSSHSHSAWAQFTGHTPLKVGAGELRRVVYDRIVGGMESAARAALADLRPARIGVFTDDNFDPGDQITRDRRGENDQLPGGNRKDQRLHLIRLDAMAGEPIAVVVVYGVHGTLNSEDNPLASTDAPGAMERMVAEQFDRPVVVMHVQAAGADTSPAGHGSLDCGLPPGAAGDPCLQWLSDEGHGRAALTTIMDAWTSAGSSMSDQLALSMVTRSIPLGPLADTFTIRGGGLSYAPFDLRRAPDRVVWNGSEVATPIDEFNAPVGAALCETDTPLFPAAAMPDTEGLSVYGSCVRIDEAAPILSQILDLDFPDVGPDKPACQMTRTTISALRLGDYLVATVPGELSVLLADKLRAASPVDSLHTIAVGYSQGHVGYCLTPEDWLQGGYEPSITFWGPLEGEYLVEQAAALMPEAVAANRPDSAAGGVDRVAMPPVTDDLPIDNPAPSAGTVPATVPSDLWMRAGLPATAQPSAQVPRVHGLATFVWLGDDPLVRTPIVTLEYDDGNGGGFQTVVRRSGRAVDDGDLIVTYAPSPLIRTGAPQQHVWSVEWQPVPWLGSGALDALAMRGGVPLGRYRFHVVGDTWTLDSQPFDVVPGTITVGVTRAGTQLTITGAWDAPRGYRLLDASARSNRPVPLRGQEVTVAAFAANMTMIGQPITLTTNNDGQVVIDLGPAASNVARVTLSDPLGNDGQGSP